MKIENEVSDAFKVTEINTPTESVGLGIMLRRAREDAGFSIERIAMSTRISQPFIEALEKGEADKLPGAIFGRGFVRNLCKAYGKDPKEFLLALDEIISESKVRDSKLATRDEKRHQQLQKGVLLIQPNEWKKRLKLLAPQNYLQVRPLVLIAVTVGVVLIIGNLWQDRQEGSFKGSSVAKKESDLQPPVPEQHPAPPTLPPVIAQAGPQVEDARSLQVATGELEVELRVLEPVSITLTRDKDKQVAEKLQVQTYKYQFKHQFKLFVEDASRVEIFFKGHRVAESAVKGESRRLTFVAPEAEIAKRPVQPAL